MVVIVTVSDIYGCDRLCSGSKYPGSDTGGRLTGPTLPLNVLNARLLEPWGLVTSVRITPCPFETQRNLLQKCCVGSATWFGPWGSANRSAPAHLHAINLLVQYVMDDISQNGYRARKLHTSPCIQYVTCDISRRQLPFRDLVIW